jgi:hypothetical protein
MKLIFVAALFAACCAPCFGQDFNAYKTLLPQGPVPKDFTEQSSSKVTSELKTINAKNARQKKMKKKFVLESTFSIDDFLASGNVLFNDEVSLYLDLVLQEILKPYPELQKKIHVYAVKSSSVNAFTTNNGLIFVNLGLLSRLENEAQLAFILSHEVVHFQKKHVINSYVTNFEIEKGRDYRKLSVSEKGFAKSTYSKELESEADLAGSMIYSKSDYLKDSIEEVFDILKLADFPLYWGGFHKKSYESGKYIFPDSLTLDGLKDFEIEEDYDDTNSSHPNIKKRRDAVRIKLKESKGGEPYKISKTRFNLSQKIARYELCRQLLLEHRYAESLAMAISLKSENPESSYLRETIAKAYYGMAIEHLDGRLKLNEDKWVGEAARVAAFVQKQSSYELAVLALRQLYLCQEAAPGNVEISLMLKDLMQAFSKVHEGLNKNFLRTPEAKPIKDLKHRYTQFAFLDFQNTDAFFNLLDKHTAPVKMQDTIKKKKRKKKAPSLKINKVVIVNPLYKKVDTRKKQKMRHFESEEVLININDKINDAAIKLSLNTDIINPNTLTSGQVSQMQSNSILNDWIDEQMRSQDKTISPIYNEMLMLSDKHKTDHFMWMGCIAVKSKRYFKGAYIGGAVLMPSIAPWSAAYVFTPQGNTLYFALVFNVRSQELELLDVRQMSMKDNNALLQSNIYYTLFSLKK